jgi:2,4-dienoyl-CoA reductase-like NADH-dependent reductase (Old Yellow Enzyme family)
MSEANYAKMFKPIKIGNAEIKNRLVMAPATNNFSQGGYPTYQQIAYHAARAKGGVGLIITSPAKYGMPGYQGHVLSQYLSERGHMPIWNEFVETIHAFGAKAFGQIAPGASGRQNLPGSKAKGVSPVPVEKIAPENIPKGEKDFEARKGLSCLWDLYKGAPTPEELTIEEIQWNENSYVVVAKLMRECGFDGAELHFAHGYLGDNFISPRTNFRKDEYGGSFENRTRFFRNAVTKTRAQVGNDFVLGARLTGEEHMPGGLTIEESSRVAKMGEEVGLDYIHLSAGCWEAAKWYVPDEDGTMLPQAEVMKRTLKIPVITPSIHRPVAVEEAIREGKTDLVSLCRPLIADPEWVNKVAQGDENRIRRCIRCLACLRRTRHGLGMRCEVNREVGQEQYMPGYYRNAAPFRKEYFLPK